MNGTKILGKSEISKETDPKYNDTVPLCLKIRGAKDGNGAGDIWGTTARNKRVPISGFMGIFVVVVVVVVVFTLKAVPVSTQYFLASVLVQLTRTPSVVTG